MDIKKKLAELEKKEGFFKHNNYHIDKITDNNIILKADINANSMNPYGGVHGGFIFGLSDTVMGILAAHNGRIAVTVDTNISYIKPGNGKYITAKAEIIREGENICFLKSNIYNDKKDLVAIMEATYYYIDERK